MKKGIRFLGLFLAVCLLLSTAAFAAETKTQVIQELDVAITIPAEWQVYDKAAIQAEIEASGFWDLLRQEGGEEIEEFMPIVESIIDSIYLAAGDISEETQEVACLCEVIAFDLADLIQAFSDLAGQELGALPDEEPELDPEFSLSFSSLDELTEEELEATAKELDQSFKEAMQELDAALQEEFGMKLDLGWEAYRNEQAAFLVLNCSIEIEGFRGETAAYYAVRDGKVYAFGFSSNDGPFTKEEKETVQSVMDSVRFQQSTYSPSGFADVKGHWAEDSIAKVTELGLFSGTSASTFDPNGGMTRAMLVQVLHRLAGEPEAEPAQFTDVAEDAWYAKAVAWAAENGIVEGADGKFRPADLVTRQELAAILYRYCGEEAEAAEDALGDFTDAASVAQWALAPVSWAVNRGLLNGSDGKLMPAQTATRAQVAAILVRYLEAE